MAYLDAAGFGVVQGRFALPSSGRGTADLRLSARPDESPPQPGDAVTLTFQDGTSYATTCIRAGSDRGAWRVLLVQGAGGIRTWLPAKFYRAVPLRTVLKDICSAAGEVEGTLDVSAQLGFWVRQQGSAQQALEAALLHAADRRYYFDEDGRLNVARPAPTPFSGQLMRVAGDQAGKVESFAGAPSLTPRHTIDGREISRLEHRIGGGPRTDVWFA